MLQIRSIGMNEWMQSYCNGGGVIFCLILNITCFQLHLTIQPCYPPASPPYRPSTSGRRIFSRRIGRSTSRISRTYSTFHTQTCVLGFGWWIRLSRTDLIITNLEPFPPPPRLLLHVSCKSSWSPHFRLHLVWFGLVLFSSVWPLCICYSQVP